MDIIVLILLVLFFYVPLFNIWIYRFNNVFMFLFFSFVVFMISSFLNLASIEFPSVFLFVVSIFIMYSIFEKDLPYIIKDDNLSTDINFSTLAYKFLYFTAFKIFITIFVSILITIVESTFKIENEVQETVNNMSNANDTMLIISSLISVCIIAPITEEYVFRYFLYDYILKNRFKFNIYLSAVFSSFIFAIMHDGLGGMINAFICGLVLTYIYQKDGLLYAILAHFTFNAIASYIILAF